MRPSRRAVLSFLLTFCVAACGGSTVSVLHSRGRPTGSGPASLDVKNASDVSVSRLFVQRSDAVQKARASGVAPGSSDDVALWGEDQLGNAPLPPGRSFTGLRLPEGRYDLLAVDPDGREQLVQGLPVAAGGRYEIKIRGDWAMAR